MKISGPAFVPAGTAVPVGPLRRREFDAEHARKRRRMASASRRRNRR